MATETAPPSRPPPPPGGDVDRAAPLMAIYWAEAVVATVIVSLRMYARYINKSYGADDWVMLLTLVSCSPRVNQRLC
jgi:hypothetical protein